MVSKKRKRGNYKNDKKRRSIARRKKGSKNREKARLELARKYERVAAQRANFTHQLSTAATRACTLVAIEDLNVRGMLANHKLAKSIADAAWGKFFNQLSYKGQWYGYTITAIGRFQPSSITCSVCGFLLPKLSLSTRF